MLIAILKNLRPLVNVFSDLYFRTVYYIFNCIYFFVTKQSVKRPEDHLLLLSATKAAKLIHDGELSSVDLVDAYIERIREVNGIINAVVQNDFIKARETAHEIDDFIKNHQRSTEEYEAFFAGKPLLGVPFTLKDCIEVEGLVCSVGMTYRRDTRPDKDAIVVQRMKEAGAIVLAITNVPEVCMWWESVNTLYGRSKNPYDTRRITGGSSGGEAALIGAAGSVIGLGSDIGGSIRMPCNFNGIFGLKPTPGFVPLTGHWPAAEGYRVEMLRIGPMCRYAEDLLLVLKVLVGNELAATLQLQNPVNLRKLRLFYMEGLKTPFAQTVSFECKDAVRKAVMFFETKYDVCGIRLDLPFAHYAVEFFLLSMEVPESPSFARYMTDLTTDLNCLLELGKWVVGKSNHTLPGIIAGIIDKQSPFNEDQKAKLLAQRDRLNRELKELLLDDGILLFPSFPTVAPYHNQPLFTPLNFAYTALWNTLALPVVQCPLGLNRWGLPIGVQAVGSPGTDRLLIALARDLEDAFGGWRPAID
ncbi:unnamed protein product [Enterobius vermicularis]|uniref:Amidase domain-containing protein n=1 Tax=Enterobius vermicularis TaxID=51028 RepID=A0A0N4VIA9_ENTVE|nr:unnamed protein product [Enterobius vermicularis]